MNNITVNEVSARLKAAESIVILCHRNPDEDTAGSAYALLLALRSIKKNAYILCQSKPSKRGAPYIDAEVFVSDPSSLPLDKGSLFVSVDVASENMLGELSFLADRVDIRLDHHESCTPFAKYNLNRPDDTACALLVFDVIKELCPISAEMASALYTAISSDSGCFRYSNTNAAAHRAAAELIELGADASGIAEALFEVKTNAQMRALRLGLESIRYICFGKVALIVVTNKEKRREGLSDSDLDELASISRQTEGVILGIVLKQTDNDPKCFKVSMRSREPVDCAAICRRLGGGGHQRASGASIRAENAAEAEEILMSSVLTELSK